MKIKIKKAIKTLHLWLGLTSGLVVFIVALTGAIYVFSDDIIKVTESSFTRVEPQKTQALLPSQLLSIALKERQRYLGSKKVTEWNWATLYMYKDPAKAVRFSSRHYENPNQLVDMFINPYTGEVLKTRDTYADPFWDFIADLHTTLLLGEVGTYIVQYATLVFLVMLISGVIIWWPKNKSGAKQRFWLRWKPNYKWKRKNYDLHNVLGFYACWILIFMTITGLGWSFMWFRETIFFGLNSKIPVEQKFNFKMQPSNSDAAVSYIDKVYALVKTTDSRGQSYQLNLAVKDNQPFNVFVQQTENWAPANEYNFDPQTGALLSKKLYKNLSDGEKYDQMAGDIHYGWIFGWYSKIPVFFACLIAASLPVTGFYIWWGRRKK